MVGIRRIRLWLFDEPNILLSVFSEQPCSVSIRSVSINKGRKEVFDPHVVRGHYLGFSSKRPKSDLTNQKLTDIC